MADASSLEVIAKSICGGSSNSNDISDRDTGLHGLYAPILDLSTSSHKGFLLFGSWT
jgi:hypothetical protein